MNLLYGIDDQEMWCKILLCGLSQCSTSIKET